jgi:SRSO17 transposase
VRFAAKPELALEMISGAVAAGVPAAWVAGDEAYGDSGAFRARVARLGLGYVVAVSCDHRIPAFPGGKRKFLTSREAHELLQQEEIVVIDYSTIQQVWSLASAPR